MCVCVSMHAAAHTWRSEDNLVQSLLSFRCVNPKDCTLVVLLLLNVQYPTSIHSSVLAHSPQPTVPRMGTLGWDPEIRWLVWGVSLAGLEWNPSAGHSQYRSAVRGHMED